MVVNALNDDWFRRSAVSSHYVLEFDVHCESITATTLPARERAEASRESAAYGTSEANKPGRTLFFAAANSNIKNGGMGRLCREWLNSSTTSSNEFSRDCGASLSMPIH